ASRRHQSKRRDPSDAKRHSRPWKWLGISRTATRTAIGWRSIESPATPAPRPIGHPLMSFLCHFYSFCAAIRWYLLRQVVPDRRSPTPLSRSRHGDEETTAQSVPRRLASSPGRAGLMLRTSLAKLTLTAALLAFGVPSAAAQDKIRLGYAISKTGPFTGGASVTTLPNYQLWVKDVNEAGGISLGGKRVPIEIIEYDDRSNSEEAVKAIERLGTEAKVDIILPPWSTGLNLAVGPTFNRLGYPHLAVTAATDRAPEMAKRWPNSFWFLGASKPGADALVEVLSKLKAENK